MRTTLQSGDKSHATGSKKKVSFLSEKNLPRNGFRFFCTAEIVRVLRMPRAPFFYFASNSEVALKRKAKKRENQKFICALIFHGFPFQCVILAFYCCDFRNKKNCLFFRITSITAVFLRVCSMHANSIDHFVFIGVFHVQWYSGIILLATEGIDDKGNSAVVPKSMIAVILKYLNFEIFALTSDIHREVSRCDAF